MIVEEILKKYLQDNDLNGLSFDGVCCCELEDLAPCEHLNIKECRAVKFSETKQLEEV